MGGGGLHLICKAGNHKELHHSSSMPCKSKSKGSRLIDICDDLIVRELVAHVCIVVLEVVSVKYNMRMYGMGRPMANLQLLRHFYSCCIAPVFSKNSCSRVAPLPNGKGRTGLIDWELTYSAKLSYVLYKAVELNSQSFPRSIDVSC